VPSTRSVLNILRSRADRVGGAYRVYAYDPENNAVQAGMRLQGQFNELQMVQAAVSNFTGAANVYVSTQPHLNGPNTVKMTSDLIDQQAGHGVSGMTTVQSVSLDDEIDVRVGPHEEIPLVVIGSEGWEFVVMQGMVRQLKRRRIHAVMWEHHALAAHPLELEVKFMEKFGYRVFFVGYSTVLNRPQLLRMDRDFWSAGMKSVVECAKPKTMKLFAVVQGHPTFDKLIEPMMPCVDTIQGCQCMPMKGQDCSDQALQVCQPSLHIATTGTLQGAPGTYTGGVVGVGGANFMPKQGMIGQQGSYNGK